MCEVRGECGVPAEPSARLSVSRAFRPASVGLLFVLAACAVVAPPEPTGQRYVVFFKGSSAQVDEQAVAVLASAADWANKHPDMPVVVASYTDTYGSPKANADFARLRAKAVEDGLVADGLPAARIQRREIGSVKFEIDSQESRRVEVTVGSPAPGA